MKKITILISAVLLGAAHLVPAQLSVVGSQNFGRMFDLTYDQKKANTIYAITMKNHIVVSRDNGATWEVFYSMPASIGSQLSQLKISADGSELTFAVDGSNASVVVLNIATEKITKQFVLPNAADNPQVKAYSFLPGDSNILLVNTEWQVGLDNYGKAYYTKTGGSTWTEIYDTELNDKVFINAIAVSPDNSNRIYLLRGNGSMDVIGGLLISDDSGASYREELDGITLSSIAFAPNSSNELYIGTAMTFSGTPEALYHSTDGGTTFTTAPVAWNNTGNTNHINHIAINPLNNYVYVLEEDEVAISKDNGATWTKNEYELDNLTDYYYGLTVSFNPFDAGELVLGQNFTPALSKDGGETFQLIRSPYFNSDARVEMAENATGKHLYYGVQYGFVHKNLTTGEENARDIKALTAFGTFGSFKIFTDPKTEGRIFKYNATSMGATLRMSNDYGQTFQVIVSNSSNQMLDLKTDPVNPNKIWASFAQYSEGELVTIDFSDPADVTVTPVSIPTMQPVTQILHTGTTSAELLIASGSELYRTIDGGANWLNVPLAGATPDFISDIAQNPLQRNELALATSNGVYTSTNGGQTWSQTQSPEVKMVQYSDTVSGHMIAANYVSDYSSFALLYSSDHGATWTQVDADDLWNVESASIYADFTGNTAKVYIATFDLGIVTYDLTFANLGMGNTVKSDITVYPNPTSDYVYIGSDILSATLYDFSGRKVADSTVPKINISHLNNGVYLLKIITADRKEVTRKIIKK